MATDYKDKEHGDDLQRYTRRDADQTEGGSVHLHDEIGIDQILQMDGPGIFRTIKEINGVTTITARYAPVDPTILDELVVLRRLQNFDDPAVIDESAILETGFGGGDFGDGGFGRTIIP